MGFGNALVAGEIAEGGYVSEPAGDKRRAHRGALRCAVFQQQPATGLQVRRRIINKYGERAQGVRARGQRIAGLVPHAIVVQGGVVGRDVGRIAGDGIETAGGQRRVPVAGQEFDAPVYQALRVALRQFERGG